jgi:hypothetical protein
VFSQAVQQALQKRDVPLLAGHTFTVMFTARTQAEPLAGTDILRCEVSVSLKNGESVLLRSAPRSIAEIDRDHAVKLAAEHIANDGDFWTAAAELMR